jgi:peroxiredoxin
LGGDPPAKWPDRDVAGRSTKEFMITSICLLSCALTLAQGERADWQLSPQLSSGLELVYSGVYLEESLIPNVQHQRQYRLEANVLVLDAGVKDWQVAIMTALSLQDARKSLDKKEGPVSVRLEIAKIDLQGRAYGSDKKLLEIPLKGPPTLESGFFVPAPIIKVGRNSSWDVSEVGRPTQRWQIAGTESCNGITCIKVLGVQQSSDWNSTRADQSAWRRRDTVWLHPQLNIAQKIERIIERRDPARDTPTFRTIVRYELESRLKYPGQLFDERRKEVLKASKFHEDALPLLGQPGLHRPQIDSMIQRVSFHLDHQPATQTTPYRKAVLHIKTVLEKAQKGEVAVSPMPDDPPPQAAKALAIGERVTDFAVSCLTEEKAVRTQEYQGKPILVFFYNPATPLGKEVLGFVKQLNEKHIGKWGVMAMAVTNDADVAKKQHKELKLTFPILDGNGLRLSFGAGQTPRFVVVDGDGMVRLAETGWGFQTPHEIEDVLQRCLKKDR